MYKVDRDLLWLQYEADLLEAYGLLKEWLSKSSNKELHQMMELIFRMDTYIRTLQQERFSYDRIISENVSHKTRAISRAAKSEQKIIDLEKEIEKLNLKLKIYE
jgi:division protein CdvB (Snf7/Vps24/ESCRT-III family)